MIDNKLKEIAEHLNIRFPNAEFSKNLGFSKGVVSEYLNNKKVISKNFIKEFENYYGVTYAVMIKNIQNDKGEKVTFQTKSIEDIIADKVVEKLLNVLKPYMETTKTLEGLVGKAILEQKEDKK